MVLGGVLLAGITGLRAGEATFGSIPKWAGFIRATPYSGEQKLAPGLNTIEAQHYYGGTRDAKVIGAEWIHPGHGHIGFTRCNCESATFDVDEFGRTFFPDTAGFQVSVIDTAGNAIGTWGGFGNENCMGPESPVVDPKTNKLRPRRSDDPQDLKSPFAEPELGFSWLLGVGVTDRNAYFGDSLNLRLLRAKLVYAAEESCALP